MRDALWAEVLKARRSHLSWLTALAGGVVTAVCGLFVFILQDPARARSLGLLGGKAQISGATADWPGHLALLAQAVSVGGVILYGVITIWLFGREFSDRTTTDLLALPTSRTAIVLAKFAVASGWGMLLTAGIAVGGLAIGAILDLPGWSTATVGAGLGRIMVAAALTVALTTPFGLVASMGRGYLPAVGAMVATLFSAQVVAALGFGQYYPWSVPGLYAGIAGPHLDPPGLLGYLLVLAVGTAGVLATTLWWQRADHTR